MQNITFKKFRFCFFISLFFITLQTKAQFPFFESFKNNTASNIQFGGSPTAFLTSGTGLKDGYNDPEGDGYLRLTRASSYQTGSVWSDLYAFPSAYGMTISFEYYIHSGSGADGLAFILFDATASPISTGAYGASLGYAQNDTDNGFSKGYLGVGIDEYGGFATNNGGKNGGVANRAQNSITLRGAGSGKTGYPFLKTATTTSFTDSFTVSGNDRTATNQTNTSFRKIEIVLKPRIPQDGFFIDVYITHGNTKTLVIDNYLYVTPAPPKLKFAITSSTGSDHNFHEIRNLNLSVDLATLLVPIARPNFISECSGLTASTLTDINDNNDGTLNTLATINRETIDLDLDTPGIQSSKTVLGKGTFTYDSITGKVTFTPLNNSVEESVEINYTFNDYYGKPSNVSTITYTPIVNRPNENRENKTITSGETYTWPVDGQPYSVSGIYSKINDGCTANQVLELNVNPEPLACNGEMQTILKDDFGSGIPERGPRPSITDFITTYNFSPTGTIGPNSYGVAKNANGGNSSWSSGGDHTTGKNGDGYMLVFDANTTVGSVFYEKKYTNLCTGSLCTFSIYAANLVPASYAGFTVKPMVKIDLINPLNGAILKSMTSGELGLSQRDELLWNELSLSFTIPLGLDAVTVRVSNGQGNANVSGNDVAFDDVSFSICVPSLTIQSERVCLGESTNLLANIDNSTTAEYSYQWQQFNGTNWLDITGETSIGYITPKLFENTKYRIRYAQTGIDITNNNNLICSGNKEVLVQVTQLAKANDITVTTIPTICEGSQTTITPSSSISTNFYWYDSSLSDAILLATSSSYNTGILTNTKTYYLGVSGDDYCENKPEDRKAVTVKVNQKPTTVTTTKNICFEDSFLWDANGQSYINSGTYTVINDGCTADQVLKLTVSNELTASFTQTNIKCKGENNGSVVITPNGGTAPYIITPAQTGLNAGNHTFTITDSNNCETTIDTTITEPEELSAVIESQTEVTCKGQNNGSVVITPNGGTAPYIITPAQTGLNAGNHTFTITDSNNCQTTIDATITEPEELTATSENIINVLRKGDFTGSVEITAHGGTAPYTITPAQTDLAAGNYTFKVTDANACVATINVTISEPDIALTAIVESQINLKCKNDSSGSVIIKPSGGSGGYIISPTQTGLTAGNHTFTVTDSNNISITIDATITEPEELSAVIESQIEVTCKGQNNGSVVITPNGGTAPYNITPAQTGLTAGNYTFTITDSNNCETTIDATITEPEELSAVIESQTEATCKGQNNGSVVITPNGGTAPYIITPVQTGLTAGHYTFTITDSNNCETTIDTTIIEPEELSAVIESQTEVTCKGQNNGSVVITPNGGTAPYKIIPAQTGLNAGNHNFTVTDSNNCETTIDATITEPEELTATSGNIINVLRKGDFTGSVEITAQGGTAPYTITPAQTDLAAGNYTFTVTDANACVATISVTISEPDIALTAIVESQINLKCKNDSSGSVIIKPSGGSGGYIISPTQTGLSAGNHTFTVTDSNNTSITVDATITEPELLSAVIESQIEVTCKGQNNGSVVITPNGGTAPYNITPAQTGLNAGNHNFTVTDSNNCETTIDATITEPEELTATSGNIINVLRKGDFTGSVEITAQGGTAPYTITPAQTDLAAGNYTFKVTDANECVATISVTISEPDIALTAIVESQINLKCKNDSSGSVIIKPSGGSGGYIISPTQTGLSAGNHTFTVTDSNNISITVDATITEPELLSAVIESQIEVTCKGENNGSVIIIPNGGTAPYIITPAQTGLNAGNHTFTITDSNNCQTSIDATITEPELLSAVIESQIEVTCKGESNGSVVITPNGGTAPYIITPAQTELNAGNYTFTITDNNNCQTSVDATITEPEELSAVIKSQIEVTCKGQNNGSVVIIPNGGTAPYIITPAQTGLNAGNHTFTITDSNNCETSVDATITEPEELSVVIKSQIEVTCKGKNNGSVIIIPNGGTAPYIITPPQTGLNAGNHTFTITDSNNCQTSIEATITEPELLSAVIESQIEVTCKGQNNGSVVITPNGGTAPYIITPPQTGLTVGNYTFTIIDSNNCQTSVDATITEPEELSAVIESQIEVTCKGENNGSVVIIPNGGTAPYIITPAQTGLNAGNHTFTITDSNNCQTSIDATITEPEELSAVIESQIEVTCKGENNGSVVITPNGGTAPYIITPAQTGLNAGNHTFTITDSNNCQTSIDATITEPELLSAVIESQIEVTCKGKNNGSVVITPNGGTAPYTITPPQTELIAGNYTFTITDSNNCETTIDTTITEPEELSAVIESQIEVTCKGENNGSVIITPNGGTAPYIITPAQTGLNAGNHTFTITDSNNCQTSVDATIAEPEELSAVIQSQIEVTCKGENNGSVVITPNGGTAPYKIIPAQTGLNAGNYTFTITDSNNCQTTIDATITEPEELSAVIKSQIEVTCKGQNNGSVVITPNGGTAPYNITPAQTGLNAGNHTFTITDSNNCETKISAIITEPQILSAVIQSQNNVRCKGESNGSVVIKPSGGTAPYIITPAQNGLNAGNHTFTITDSNNCETKISAIITEPQILSAVIQSQNNVRCKGESNGSVIIKPSGGSGNYNITPAQTGLSAGTHTFTVTDNNKCNTIIVVTITEPNILDAKILGPITPEYCSGDQDGMFSIEISGGSKPYRYSLDKPSGTFLQGQQEQNVFDFENISAGKHIVYIQDILGCTTKIDVILPEAVVLNPVVEIDSNCKNNVTSNFVTVTIDSSNTNLTDIDYALDGGSYQSKNIFTNIASGDHIISARHTNGCIQSTKTFTIDYIEPLELTLVDGELNEIVATATGGNGQYRYSFNDESISTTNKLIIYKSGIYTVTVTDKNGCTATASKYFEYIDVCIPNHFTPNGDGINDEWGPGCTIQYKNLTFTIFDRYGRIIGNYKYGQKWDGKYNGTELSSGDYWYVFKLNDNKDNREFVGHFTLYR